MTSPFSHRTRLRETLPFVTGVPLDAPECWLPSGILIWMRRSQEIEVERDAVAEFRNTLVEFLDVMVSGEVVGFGGSYWHPREGQEQLASELRAGVDQLSGAVSQIALSRGIRARLKPPGAPPTHTIPFDVFAAWSDIVDPGFTGLTREDVLGAADHLLGVLGMDAKRARRQERSLAGWVARVYRFPSEVRKAAGLDADSAAGRAVSWLTATSQAVIAGLLTAGLIALIARLF